MWGYAHHLYAVRFKPHEGRRAIALEPYGRTVASIGEGLAASRASFAQMMSEKYGATARSVALSLRIEIASGVGDDGGPFTAVQIVPTTGKTIPTVPDLADRYWRFNGVALRYAAKQKSRFDLSANCAEAFAAAADAAMGDNVGVSLAMKRGDDSDARWDPIVDLTEIRGDLRRYAALRRAVTKIETTVMGRINDISYDPLLFKVKSKSTQYIVRAKVRLRDKLRAAWGKEAMIFVKADMDADGNMKDLVAEDIKELAVQTSGAEWFESAFGAGESESTSADMLRLLRGMRGGLGGS